MPESIHPGSTLTATFAPNFPAYMVPPSDLIPWVGARLEWLAVLSPGWGHPSAVFFRLVAGSDGFALLEGRRLDVPDIVVGMGALRGIRVSGEGGQT